MHFTFYMCFCSDFQVSLAYTNDHARKRQCFSVIKNNYQMYMSMYILSKLYHSECVSLCTYPNMSVCNGVCECVCECVCHGVCECVCHCVCESTLLTAQSCCIDVMCDVVCVCEGVYESVSVSVSVCL